MFLFNHGIRLFYVILYLQSVPLYKIQYFFTNNLRIISFVVLLDLDGLPVASSLLPYFLRFFLSTGGADANSFNLPFISLEICE